MPKPSPVLDKNRARPWVQIIYPVLGLGSVGMPLRHFHTPILYWINVCHHLPALAVIVVPFAALVPFDKTTRNTHKKVSQLPSTVRCLVSRSFVQVNNRTVLGETPQPYLQPLQIVLKQQNCHWKGFGALSFWVGGFQTEDVHLHWTTTRNCTLTVLGHSL